jgi:hypothetical protein
MNASNYRCSDWKATHDFMPGTQSPTLRVTGKCTFPTDGYSVRLERAEPQGINPAVLLLDRIVTPPPGAAAQLVSEEVVNYSEETRFTYTGVMIQPGGPLIPVERVE